MNCLIDLGKSLNHQINWLVQLQQAGFMSDSQKDQKETLGRLLLEKMQYVKIRRPLQELLWIDSPEGRSLLQSNLGECRLTNPSHRIRFVHGLLCRSGRYGMFCMHLGVALWKRSSRAAAICWTFIEERGLFPRSMSSGCKKQRTPTERASD